jgi:hypothetical protein
MTRKKLNQVRKMKPVFVPVYRRGDNGYTYVRHIDPHANTSSTKNDLLSNEKAKDDFGIPMDHKCIRLIKQLCEPSEKPTPAQHDLKLDLLSDPNYEMLECPLLPDETVEEAMNRVSAENPNEYFSFANSYLTFQSIA